MSQHRLDEMREEFEQAQRVAALMDERAAALRPSADRLQQQRVRAAHEKNLELGRLIEERRHVIGERQIRAQAMWDAESSLLTARLGAVSVLVKSSVRPIIQPSKSSGKLLPPLVKPTLLPIAGPLAAPPPLPSSHASFISPVVPTQADPSSPHGPRLSRPLPRTAFMSPTTGSSSDARAAAQVHLGASHGAKAGTSRLAKQASSASHAAGDDDASTSVMRPKGHATRRLLSVSASEPLSEVAEVMPAPPGHGVIRVSRIMRLTFRVSVTGHVRLRLDHADEGPERRGIDGDAVAKPKATKSNQRVMASQGGALKTSPAAVHMEATTKPGSVRSSPRVTSRIPPTRMAKLAAFSSASPPRQTVMAAEVAARAAEAERLLGYAEGPSVEINCSEGGGWQGAPTSGPLSAIEKRQRPTGTKKKLRGHQHKETASPSASASDVRPAVGLSPWTPQGERPRETLGTVGDARAHLLEEPPGVMLVPLALSCLPDQGVFDVELRIECESGPGRATGDGL